MKYELKQKSENSKFVPFEIKLLFETEEEYVIFYDNYVIKIKVDSSSSAANFRGNVYKMGHNEIDYAIGEIK
jgi:hypothetical protein